MDLGLIWMEYIQDGLVRPLGPTKSAIGGLGGLEIGPNAINLAFLAISGSSYSKWLDLSES